MKTQIAFAIMFLFILCPIALCETSVGGIDGPNIDKDTKAQYSISPAHAKIHEGKAYEIARLAIDVGDDLSASLYLSVSAGYEAHIVFSGSSEGKAYSYFYEDPTITGGTAITPTNKNRESSNTSNVTTLLNPTISSYGTLLFSGYIPGETGPKTQGSSQSNRDEWILAGNEDYIAIVWNKGAAAKDIGIVALWYEIED